MAKKSTWMGVSLHGERSKANVMSWFGLVGENMTPYEAEVLCDNETDIEKKVRVRVIDPDDGKKYELVRTLGAKTYTITRKAIEARETQGERK